MANQKMTFLKASGTQIVDEAGQEVRLRGFSFASWLNFENFILGIPGHETGIRNAVAAALGEDLAHVFFDSLLNQFVAEDDFAFIKSIGCNMVRLPFNYRHFESDEHPFEYRPEGFAWLDKAIAWGRKYGVYLILDLHAAQGGQNRCFFADNITGHAGLWGQKVFEDRVVTLWQEIARHYQDEPVIAGFDLLNEPIPADIGQLNRIYHRIAQAVRKVNKRHILIIEGDGFSTRFSELDHPFDRNVVYSNHFYSCCGMEAMEYPGVRKFDGLYYDRAKLQAEYLERTAWIREHNAPNWFGETSVTFPPGISEASRWRFVEDMLGIAEELGDSWGFGIYKDLGKTGIVTVDPQSAWMQKTRPVRQAIQELRCNPFADNVGPNRLEELCGELGALASGMINAAGESMTAAAVTNLIRFHLCESVLPQTLQTAFARSFAGMDARELTAMMESFAWKNCRVRSGWVDVVKKVTMRATPGA